MAAYLQMGHDSWNLLGNPDIGDYKGLVLSPVNDDPTYVASRLSRLKEDRAKFEVILDPQMYNPTIEKGQLGTWSYFPESYETIDASSVETWGDLGRKIVSTASDMSLDAVCSPCPVPKTASDAYYRFVVDVADITSDEGQVRNVDVLLTAIIRLRELHVPSRALSIASILSSTRCKRVYLMFLVDDGSGPRDQLSDSTALPTAVHLVRLLAKEMQVQVAFTGHDAVLWKYSGAQDIASGKFWNLRRFSPGRWQDEPSSVKQQVPYFNAGRLLTCLRDADVLRLDRAGWFDNAPFAHNPASSRILDILRSGSGQAWTSESWVQYLRWFSNTDKRCFSPSEAEALLIHADARWADLQKQRILMVDRNNDGTHVREWLIAALEGGAR
jgi:hypothetical protein